jgi:hypothetical protein
MTFLDGVTTLPLSLLCPTIRSAKCHEHFVIMINAIIFSDREWFSATRVVLPNPDGWFRSRDESDPEMNALT